MAKRSKFKNKLQYSKDVISIARQLKKKGILSKQAKLHGGEYISYNVLKKVNSLQHLQTGSRYTALKVSKDTAKRAKDEGYQTIFGNKVIVPRDHDFIKRMRQGNVSGIKFVADGFMSEAQIPFTTENIASLIRKLEMNSLDDLKLPGEHFAFEFHGHMSHRSFADSRTFRDYLEHYKQEEKIKALKLYRLHPRDEHLFINVSQEHRRKTRTKQSRRSVPKKKTRLEDMPPNRAKYTRERMAVKAERKRERLINNPSKHDEYKERARQRARASYERRRGKK